MDKKHKSPRVFDETFKLKVVSDYYSSGASKSAIARKWEITDGSLFQWLKRWPVETKELSLPSETIKSYNMSHNANHHRLSEKEALVQRIKSLEHSLELERMRSRAYEKMIEIAEEEEGISILKKDGAKQ